MIKAQGRGLQATCSPFFLQMFQETFKIDFQDGTATMVAIFDFWSERFKLFFFLSASHSDTPTKFQVNWPFGSGEVRIRFLAVILDFQLVQF